jgi:hypothetical protein
MCGYFEHSDGVGIMAYRVNKIGWQNSTLCHYVLLPATVHCKSADGPLSRVSICCAPPYNDLCCQTAFLNSWLSSIFQTPAPIYAPVFSVANSHRDLVRIRI